MTYHHDGYFNIYKNGLNDIKAENKSAKLTVLMTSYYNYYEMYNKNAFTCVYNQAPTDIDLEFYLYCDNIRLRTYYIEDYIPYSIQLRGKTVIHYREPYEPMMNIFNSTEITFMVNPNNDYEEICYADEANECKYLYDFVFAKNYEEFHRLDAQSINARVYFFKSISLKFDSNFYISYDYNVRNKVNVSFDLPDNAIIYFNYFNLEIIADKTYYFHVIYSRLIFNIKNIVFIDRVDLLSQIWSIIEFTCANNLAEIIAGSGIKNMKEKLMCPIIIPENFTIYSPVPQYLEGLFNSSAICQSKLWSYLYSSESAKQLFESYKSFSIEDHQNDENLLENIVISVGQNDTISIPSNWTNHNIYILQENNNNININPSIITYLKDGIVLDNKTKIIVGNITINVPKSFKVNADLPGGYMMLQYLYYAKLNCSSLAPTYLYLGSLMVRQLSYYYNDKMPINIVGYNSSNKLIIKAKDQNDIFDFDKIAHKYSNENVEYSFGYDYICYYLNNEYLSKCKGKFHHASDITSLLFAVYENPDIPISVGQNMVIPYPTKDHFILDPKEDNIHIKLPYYPNLMQILENDKINLSYPDSTQIDILNRTSIEVGLEESLELIIKSNTNSSLTFSLASDVIVSKNPDFIPNFTISVIDNSYQLISENIEDFCNLFGDNIKQLIRICAHDNNSNDLCTYEKRDFIDNVFSEPFNYNEVEIAYSADVNITLPSIIKQTNVRILPNLSGFLNINKISDLQIKNNTTIIHNYWNFVGDLNVLLFKLESLSSILISEQISSQITFQLTNNVSFINLNDCVHQNSSQIQILKYGNTSNEITVFGSDDSYNNFINSIYDHEDITIIRNGTQKYICICDVEISCSRCKEDIEGVIINATKIVNDPGENVKIRIFTDFEVSSDVFTNEHDVFIDPNCKLNLTSIKIVNQNMTEGIKVDNLYFNNCTNLFLKPRDLILNIVMKNGLYGPHLNIEVDTYLKN